ncbi:MAG: preprotein translocase subunit SecG [Pseudomonadota bacterium]
METVLVLLHVCFAIAIVALVLLQRSEGGGLGLGGGGGGGGGAGSMGGLMSSRGTANLLTRATAIVAALFFATSMALSIWVANTSGPTSIVDDIPASTGTTAPAEDETGVPSVPVGE